MLFYYGARGRFVAKSRLRIAIVFIPLFTTYIHIMTNSVEEIQKQLKWIQLGDSEPWRDENKAKSKFLENPFVPIGCIATTVALGYGIYYLKKGDSRNQQRMMKYRVLAQGFTIGALALGLLVVEWRKRGNSN